jgi:hypothetical protein
LDHRNIPKRKKKNKSSMMSQILKSKVLDNMEITRKISRCNQILIRATSMTPITNPNPFKAKMMVRWKAKTMSWGITILEGSSEIMTILKISG